MVLPIVKKCVAKQVPNDRGSACNLWEKLKNAPMNRKKTGDPLKAAHAEAEKDMEWDPELSDGDPTDDLDEGELARRDNSDEAGFDELEKKRPGRGGSERSAGKGLDERRRQSGRGRGREK